MKAYGYIRVSTEEQAISGLSIESQRAKITAYCIANDIELINGIVDDASGKNLKRPGIQKILELARAHEIDAIVILKLDRLSRNTVDALTVARELEHLGVKLCSIQDYVDIKTANGNFQFTIQAGMAEWYRRVVSENTKAALDAKRARGEITGAAPYGYKRESADSQKLIVDENEKYIIEHAAQMLSCGKNPAEIARALNRMGKTNRSGKSFTNDGVRAMLITVEKRKAQA